MFQSIITLVFRALGFQSRQPSPLVNVDILVKLNLLKNHVLFQWNLMEKESIIVDEFFFFASNIKKGVCVVLIFFSFLKKFEKNKIHSMFSLLLNLRFKNFHLMSSFIGREQGVVSIEEYIKNLSIPCCCSVITICILSQKLKVFLLALVLMRTPIWIYILN